LSGGDVPFVFGGDGFSVIQAAARRRYIRRHHRHRASVGMSRELEGFARGPDQLWDAGQRSLPPECGQFADAAGSWWPATSVCGNDSAGGRTRTEPASKRLDTRSRARRAGSRHDVHGDLALS
jgi:hypothetical protein